MNNEIILDLDRVRLQTILKETYETCGEVLETEFEINLDDFISELNKYLDSNRVAVPIQIGLPSKKYPELKIEVDIRKKSVISRMYNRKLRIHLNRYLTKL